MTRRRASGVAFFFARQHEYDTCCFSPHGRHDKMLRYEAQIRAELQVSEASPLLPTSPLTLC